MTESAAIEGQTIPPSKVLASGHMDAYVQMLLLADSGADLGQDDLKNWQKMIGREQQLWGDYPLPLDALGQYRQWDIMIRNSRETGGPLEIGAKWLKISDEMDDLWKTVNVSSRREYEYDTLSLAAILHHRFERIHPFGDGNGRSGRLLALWFLRRHRPSVNPVLFTNWDKAAWYYPCFREKSPERMIAYFNSHQEDSWE